MNTEVMDTEVELNFHGVSGDWTVPGKTKTVCFTFGVTGPRKGLSPHYYHPCPNLLLFAPSLNTGPGGLCYSSTRSQ